MNYDPNSLRDLEARLGEATGPDRVLDFWVAVEMGPNPLKHDTGTEKRPNWVNDSGQEFELWSAEGRYGFMGYHVAPAVTASLDAAVGLVERHGYYASFDQYGNWASVRHRQTLALTEARAHDIRLALCLALVKAIGKEK